MHSIIGYYKEKLGTHTFFCERVSHTNVRVICMYYASAFLRKWEIVGGWPLFHSTPSHSFLCLEAAAKSSWLWAVLSAPRGGVGVSLCYVRPLSVVLQAETHRDRERDWGWAGGGPLGRLSEERFPLEGSCGRPLLVVSTFEKEGKRKQYAKNTTPIFF